MMIFHQCIFIISIFSLLPLLTHAFSVSSSSSSSTPPSQRHNDVTSTPILTASSPNDVIQFDIGCVANPVIIPPYDQNENDNGGEWQCYYYGNNGSWNNGLKCYLPTGSTGLAISTNNCKTWTKVVGQEEGGSILSPSTTIGENKSWDCVHTGVGDVIRINEKELHMYYFGGNDEEMSFGGMSMVGFRMRIGRAKSFDNGRTWVKDETYLLDYDESEGLFASWPRIVTFDDGRPWIMYYHSFNGSKWRVYSAESTDGGDTWIRSGLVLEGDESENAFDYSGIGTRSIVKWRDGLLMIYEGVDNKSTHRLGAAYSEDGKKWNKLNDGKPILEPFVGPLGEWTKQVIGTPFVVSMPNGSLRIYHCGKDGSEGKMSIGVVESVTGDIEPGCWKALH